MTDRPYNLRADQVRAVLDGRLSMLVVPIRKRAALDALAVFNRDVLLLPGSRDLLPFKPGDTIWCREAWRVVKASDELKPGQMTGGGYTRVWHEVDRDNCDQHGKLRSSQHMPRWASRISITVKGVTVKRVQDVTEEEAIAAGCRSFFDHDNLVNIASPNGGSIPMVALRGPIDDFKRDWTARHGPDAWDRNDWCAFVEVERV